MPGAMPCNSTWSIPLKQHPDDFVLDTSDRFHASVRACHAMAYLDQVYHRKPVDGWLDQQPSPRLWERDHVAAVSASIN